MLDRHFLGFLSVLAILGSATATQSQTKDNVENVRFRTVDGVEIHGVFHKAAKAKAPTVLFLHALKDDDCNRKSWVDLAERLQKEDYHVLRFDFRGHGLSKEISADAFWRQKQNAALVKGAAQKKTSMELKDMDPKYYPVLINDIAAAKAFLDLRHDEGRCNTKSMFLIGAETGATLGAIWLAAEWNRYQVSPKAPPKGKAQDKPIAEGRDILGCFWLSIAPKLGNRFVPLTKIMEPTYGPTATVLFHGDGDVTGKSLARMIHITLASGDKAKLFDRKLAGDAEFRGSGKRVGANLLTAPQGNDHVVAFLKLVRDEKTGEWAERGFAHNQYVWQPGALPAKGKNDKQFVFDTYERFIK